MPLTSSAVRQRSIRALGAGALAVAVAASRCAGLRRDDERGAAATARPTPSRSGSRRTCPTGSPRPRRSSTPSPRRADVEVELVPVAEDQFNQLLTSSAAAGDLPDVIGGVSLPQVRTLSANELLDTDAIARGHGDARPERHLQRERADLTQDGDTQLAIPSESWTQLLVYRKDLFEEAGLRAADVVRRDPRGRRRSSTAPSWPASSAPTSPVTRSPSRPSSTSRSATAASSSTTRARSRSTAPSASRRSSSTATWSTTTRSPARRTSTPPGRRTSPARRR